MRSQLPCTEPESASARDLISRIGRDIIEEACVIFVGAGSTTEKPQEEGGFYHKIKSLTSAAHCEESPNFPDLMQSFCDERDGGHHNLLVREAIDYLERCLLPGPSSRAATEFSTAVAAIPFFKVFVTTNWDPVLERALDVLVPITGDRDMAFWIDRKKQVLKLHGCITRPHTIVATRSDYDNCIGTNPLLFNKLRDLMATKTFLFTGYSRNDSDFREMWDSITSRLGPFSRMAFALDPLASDEEVAYWEQRGIRIYRVRDVQFVRELRKHLVECGLMPSESLVDFLMQERYRIVQIHVTNEQNCDGAMSSAMYQDGLLHQLDDILDGIQLGTKKQKDFENDLGFTLNTLKSVEVKDDVIEIAYWSGRYTALQAFFEAEQSQIPAYFHPYRLLPMTKLVKGTRWNMSPRRKELAGEASHVVHNGAFKAVCKECARKLHER